MRGNILEVHRLRRLLWGLPALELCKLLGVVLSWRLGYLSPKSKG